MKYFIKTFGCQMNTADSEKIRAVFKAKGYKEAKTYQEAQVVIINTCSVRQSAEDRVMGLVNNLLKEKSKKLLGRWRPAESRDDSSEVEGKSKPKVILTGCMLRYPLPKLKSMLPSVDKFIKLKDLIENCKLKIENSKASAFVKIMEGCDNYCTYCVVPSSRGREVSRPIEEIYCEIQELVKRGVTEIMLLGQNVNSYHKSSKLKVKSEKLQFKVKSLEKKYKNNFAVLLALLNGIKGLEKIKFMTSNPQDLSDDIIEAMKLPKVDRYLHLAVQSGDDEILKRMNRKYTSQQYLDLVKKIKNIIPGINIGTDIIVGFPGETKKNFEHTVTLCKKAKFKLAYINKYSPRWGTPSYKFKDDVSIQEKKRRWLILEKLINKQYESK